MPCRYFTLLLSIIIWITILSFTAWPHGGGIDGYGCHNDRKHGGYHCHQGPLAGKTFNSQIEMLAVLKETNSRKDNAKADDTGLTKGKQTCIRDRTTGKVVCGDTVP
jgi:hypothetical protein